MSSSHRTALSVSDQAREGALQSLKRKREVKWVCGAEAVTRSARSIGVCVLPELEVLCHGQKHSQPPSTPALCAGCGPEQPGEGSSFGHHSHPRDAVLQPLRVPSTSREDGFQLSCPSPLAEAMPSPRLLRSLALNYSESSEHSLLLSLQN